MLTVAAIFFGLVHLQGVNGFPKTPDHQWAYDGLDLIGQWGLIPDVLEEKKTVRDYQSRMGFATACKLAAPEFRQLEMGFDFVLYRPALLRDVRYMDDPMEVPRGQLTEMREEMPKIAAFLQRGAIEFAPELRSLGSSPADIDRDVMIASSGFARIRLYPIGYARQEFSDVPAGHWAAGAILDLRKAGVLRGYSDGSFGGQW